MKIDLKNELLSNRDMEKTTSTNKEVMKSQKYRNVQKSIKSKSITTQLSKIRQVNTIKLSIFANFHISETSVI